MVSDTASWDGASESARLAVTVHVREAQRFTRVWLDVYALDREGGLVCFDTHDLQHAEPAEGGAEVFAMDAPV